MLAYPARPEMATPLCWQKKTAHTPHPTEPALRGFLFTCASHFQSTLAASHPPKLPKPNNRLKAIQLSLSSSPPHSPHPMYKETPSWANEGGGVAGWALNHSPQVPGELPGPINCQQR